MKKYKANKSFQELGIENSYQGLETWQYYDLKNGKIVEIEQVPIPLIENKFVKEIKKEKKSWQ